MVEMTDELLSEIERRAKAATPGPWKRVGHEVTYRSGGSRVMPGIETDWDHAQAKGPMPVIAPCYSDTEGEPIHLYISDPDADYLSLMDPATTISLITRIRELGVNHAY